MRVSAVIAAALVAVACSKSSTSPGDPFVGNWTVTFARWSDSSFITPSTFTLTVTKNGTTYTASTPQIEWSNVNGGSTYPFAMSQSGSSFAAGGDTLDLVWGGVYSSCSLFMRGTVSGNGASGTDGLAGGCGPVGSWTAMKQ